jgi:hypothetical protein
VLHHSSLALAGAAICLVFAAGVVVTTVISNWTPRAVLAASVVLMIVGLAVLVVSAWLSSPSLVLFLVGRAVLPCRHDPAGPFEFRCGGTEILVPEGDLARVDAQLAGETKSRRMSQIRQQGENLAEGSYGRGNREAVAATRNADR